MVPSFGPGPAREGATRIRTLVGTSLDQVAVGPGILLREWKENARRYFEFARGAHALRHGTSGHPRPAFAILSGRYAVDRRRWKEATVEVYRHPDHGRNVESMFRCVREAGERHPFSPDSLLRIVELPHAGKARVFPDAILFSEWSEFALNLRRGRGDEALCESVRRAIVR